MVCSMAASGATSGRWLFGPLPDLLLGCGGLYACILVIFAVGGPELRAAQAAWIGPLLVLLLGTPHYGATLVRVYDHRVDRRSYWIFAVHATLLITAAFIASLFSGLVASCLVTVYLTWSPWHYSGQNYGLALLFLRRRNVAITPTAKRLLYASFILSYALTFLIFHGDVDSQPTPEFASGPRALFVSLGIPQAVTKVAFPLLLASYGATLLSLASLLLRRSSLRDLAPTVVMILSQALWFSIPVALRYWRVSVGIDPLRWELRDYYFFWIALGHATQYLWVTTYYARRSQGWRSYSNYLGKTLLAGAAIWTLPVVLCDPNQVGMLPNSSALALLVASAVNIHHFVLDGAIWKLRHSRIANILIRPAEADANESLSPGSFQRWQRRAVWTLASLGCALAIFKYAHQDVLFPRAVLRGDFAKASAVLERLNWISHVSDEARVSVARAERQRARQLEAQRRRREHSTAEPNSPPGLEPSP
jgi:hypothetical protein